MRKILILKVVVIAIALCLIAINGDTLDYPHNNINSIACDSCHLVSGSEASLLIEGLSFGQDRDDTQYNALCWSCHNDIKAPYVKTHSSLQIDESYGQWTVECRTCHNPHTQKQLKTYADEGYLTTDTSTGLTDTTLVDSSKSWTADEFEGFVLIPNVANKSYGYKITGNTGDTITVEGDASHTYKYINLTKAASGDTYAVVYGKLIKSIMPTGDIIDPSDTKPGDMTVKFFNDEGTNSFADGDSTYDGVCEVCHTMTNHFRNDVGASDQLHGNLSSPPAGTDCIECHSHAGGFAHGGGSGVGCDECHGHDPGYDADGAEGDDPITGGGGTYQTHSTHTEDGTETDNKSDNDHEKKGPKLACDACHNTASFPDFADGVSYAAYKSGTPTTVCNECHSPNGTYDGVSDEVIGAKNNWRDGVYEADGSLKAVKKKWCAGCHDEVPSKVNGVDAPNIIGDEDDSDGDGTYGPWGFYKSGHGLPSSETYPASGGVTVGAARGCLDCHISTTVHVDTYPRTFDCSDDCDNKEYRESYRLKTVSGLEPMNIPFPVNASPMMSENYFPLCFSCHASGPFVNSSDSATNLKTEGVNRHEYHLAEMNLYVYPSDYNYASSYNSRPTCVICHNVHGSTRLAMVRDGKLIGREPGLKIWYNNDDIVNNDESNTNPPSPENLPLSASTGTIWRGLTSAYLCTHCHGSDNTLPEYRDPFQDVEQVPYLEWTGETNYTSDGVNMETGDSGSIFTFRVKYADTNNDSPSPIEVWVDVEGDGYEADDKYVMSGVDSGDVIYTNGKIYSKSLVVTATGGSVINYRFYAYDGKAEATGDPVAGGTITISNNVPVLSWLGVDGYISDGVAPDAGKNGQLFEFMVKYTDADNTPPSSIEVWVDVNDTGDGTYEDGTEKFTMTKVDPSDTTFSDGMLYKYELNINYGTSDGIINYTFRASDGSDPVTGSPIANNTLTVLSSSNNPPSLEWVTETCVSKGVKPVSGPDGGDFEFIVKYTDLDNIPPSSIQVWVDENDTGNGTFEETEKFDLEEVDASDTVYTDGKLYKITQSLSLAGDNSLYYHFYASDGTDSAIGDPTSNNEVTVVSAYKVRPSGGVGWHSTIQDAVDAVDGEQTILVYEGTYEDPYLYFYGGVDNNTIVRSVCGPDTTIIKGDGSNYAVYLLSNTGSEIDGFTITNGTSGVMINSGNGTISNSKIYGNSIRGISTANSVSVLTLNNSEIYSHTTASGAGVYINGSVGNTITGTIVRDNIATEYGGGMYINGGGAVITDTVFKDNKSNVIAGGILVNGANADFYKTIIKNNVSLGNAGGVYLTNSGSSVEFYNSLIVGNKGTEGGAVFTNGGPVNIVNSTIADNEATTGAGGAIRTSTTSTVIVRNSILWNNMAATYGHLAYFNFGTLNIEDSIISTGSDGVYNDSPYIEGFITTNITGYISESDPMFVDTSTGNYHIQVASNAVDNANAAYAPDDDIDGDARPQGSADDIGFDEVVSVNSVPVLSWTGEVDYSSDGINPENGLGGSSFEFRINYLDNDNEAPESIQVWLDEDDSGTYEYDEKYDMSETNADIVYSDGKLYGRTLAILYAGDGTLNYRFYATDGKADASGTPVSDSSVALMNNSPLLSWTGEINYIVDGANPDSGVIGGDFEFRVDYSDIDNMVPEYVEVWIDEDDSTVFDLDEKYSMTETDSGDDDYTDSKWYTRTLAISAAGTHKYCFKASDGGPVETKDATGTPTNEDGSYTVTVVDAPLLSWTGETNYSDEGVNPDSAVSGSSFEFRIKYTESGNVAPTSIQLWVDINDTGAGTYEPGEKYDMTEIDELDTTYSDGKLYTKTLNISEAGDGDLYYRFYASNGTEDAVGDPISNNTVIINDPPTLAWTGDADYTSDGVDPDYNTGGSSFTFKVEYTDSDNDGPSIMQVWVDEDDSGTYESGEKYDMTVDGGNGVYTDGEKYSKALTLAADGDGILNYRFYAKDAADEATGDPASASTVMVTSVAELLVPSEYATIQAAINAAAAGNTVKVSDGTYSENINYNGKLVTVESLNGAASTIIQGDGSDAPVVTFTNGELTATVLDGFTINNQTSLGSRRGIYITSNASPTVKNSIIRGNDPESYVDGANIFIDGGGITIENTSIGGESGTPDTGDFGTAIYAINSSSRAISITDSTIAYNNGTSGAAVHFADRSTTTTITNTNFNNNISTSSGAAIFASNAPIDITGGSINDNSSTYDGTGIYISGASSTLSVDGTTIINNSGRIGAGIYASGTGAVTISSATVDSNDATSNGGGIFLLNTTGASTITGTSASGNTSVGAGAGLYFNSTATTSLKVTNSNVDNNTITNTGDGGGMYLAGTNVTVEILDGTVNGNTGRIGGGIIASGGIDLAITGATINSNNADYSGGGISIIGADGNISTLDISKAVISGNVADDSGGGINVGAYTTATITSCNITGNLTELNYDGGGVYTNSTTSIYGTTIAGNYAKRYGGGLRLGSGTTVKNSIIWGNASGTSGAQISGTPNSITYTDIQSGFAGTGNIDSDPLFALFDPEGKATSTLPSATGNFHIVSGISLVIDAGDGDTPDYDIDGDIRPYGANIDMGSDEYMLDPDTTVAGTATAEAVSDTAIDFSMPYTSDSNGNNIYSVEYKLSSSGTWLDWGTNPKAHTTSPYADTITGLTAGETYDVRLTYSDTEGVSGTAQQTIESIALWQTVSGAVYTDEGSTTIADGATVRLIVNGSSVATDTTVSGAYSITAAFSSGDAILVYIDEAGTDGTTVTVPSAATLSGLDIYGDRVITRHDNSGSLTNTIMSTALGAYSDTEILYSVSGSDLTLSGAGIELYIPGGHSFVPGGTVTAVDMDINGTLNAEANAVNVSGGWDVTGGVFTSTGTVTFNAATGTQTILPGGTDADHDFQNIIFNDSAGAATFQLGGAIDTDGNFTVTDGIVDTTVSNYAITVGGNFSQAAAGQVEANSSTITVTGDFSADGTTDSTDYNNASLVLTGGASGIYFTNLSSFWDNGFNNLTVGQSGVTDVLQNGLAIRNMLTVGSGNFTGASIYMKGSGDIFTFDAAANLSVLMVKFNAGAQNLPALVNGYDTDLRLLSNGAIITQTGNVTLNSGKHLYIDGDGIASRINTFNTAGYDLTIGSDLILGTGSDTATKTLTATNSTITVGGNFTINDSSNVFTSTGSTVVLNGTSQSINGSVTFNNLTKSVSSADTLTFEAGETTTINGTVILNGASGQLLTLASSTGTSVWNFNVSSGATKTLDHLSVSWSDATASDATQKPVGPTNSTDAGNNTEWFAVINTTTVGTATAVEATTTSIDISMPYSDDTNADNTYTVKYKLSSSGTWLDWGTNPKAHTVSPYTDTITGLTAGESYNVQMTYNDADTVSGTNPQQVDLTLSGGGTTHTVCASGCDFTVIQTAISDSVDGDTVQVTDTATYSENINFGSKNIIVKTLVGATIQGSGSNVSVVTFNNSAITSSAVLDGFTIDNVAAANSLSRGISITNSAAPTIKNVTIEGNNTYTSWVPGSGIYINGGSATIETSTIGGNSTNKNTCQLGCGLYVTNLSAAVSISNTDFSENTANQGSAIYLKDSGYMVSLNTVTLNGHITAQYGGAIHVNNSKISLADCTLNGNSITAAGMHGGAIYGQGAGSTITLANTNFTGNTAISSGGAIYMTGSTEAMPLSITGGTFTGSGGTDAGSLGGAIYLGAMTNQSLIDGVTFTGLNAQKGGAIYTQGALKIQNNSLIYNNTSTLDGGGIRIDGASASLVLDHSSVYSNTGTIAGGILVENGGSATIQNGSDIYSNIASGTLGGGIYNTTSGTLTITASTIRGNKAIQHGGGIYNASTATITNSIISGNVAGTSTWENGGGINNAGTITIMNSTIAGNHGPNGGGLNTTGTATITNSIFWDNLGNSGKEQINGTVTMTFSDVEGGLTNQDPLFVTPAQASSGTPNPAGNFHIQAGSNVVDLGTGTGAPAVDIDGQARPLGSGIDMGADEKE